MSESYKQVHQGLTDYDRRKRLDHFVPEGEKVCPRGITCAFAQWLELRAEDIDGIEAYYGQQQGDDVILYRIDKSFYRGQALTPEEQENGLKVEGTKACQYQLCVDENHCEDLTLTEQGKQLVADIQLNELPALLSFCQDNAVCGVVQQDLAGVWGRDDVLYPGDVIIPQTIRLVGNELSPQVGTPLAVNQLHNVRLHQHCVPDQGTISVGFFGANGQREVQRLCDKGDCLCQENDTDMSCIKVGAKAGVYLK